MLRRVLAVLVSILLLLGAAYEVYARRRDRRRFPPPGQLVDIDGRRLHVVVQGRENPGPTVILDAGMVSFSSNWAWVQPEIAKVAPVVAYDRAGLGWSDPAPGPNDAAQSAQELHAALIRLGISGPFVVVGHSYGGLTARTFAALYPREVAGMVLVDSSHPDQWTRIPMGMNGRLPALSQRIAAWLARFGLFRLLNPLAKQVANGLPQRQYNEVMAFAITPQSLDTSSNALSIWHERTRPLVNNAPALGNMPLIVLSAAEQPQFADLLTELQADLARLSDNSRHVTVQGATHEALLSDPQHAQVVTRAILDVVEAVRSSVPLGEATP